MSDAFIRQVRATFAAGNARGAEAIVRQRLDEAPADATVRIELARLLRARGAIVEALQELDTVSPEAAPLLRASVLTRLGRFDEAIAAQRQAIAEEEHPRALLGLTHLLKTVGAVDEAEAASRRALAIDPQLGEAWWSLSSLKTLRFSEGDRAAMEALLADPALAADNRIFLQFALARAFDSAGSVGQAWEHLASANRLQSERVNHRPDDISALVDATCSLMTADFFAERRDWGASETGPIFILGMPRSGSTLLEQMLASHSQIEGTSELPYMIAIARQLSGSNGVGPAYLTSLAALRQKDIRSLGSDYLRSAATQRHSDRPWFVDKMPNNWLVAGLICLILPKARIIDMRRNPMDCGFSNFQELFAGGQGYSYSLDHIGRYYRDYLKLMRHFDAVLPGRIHHVIYERLVEDPEAELRALFDYLGLPFEASSLAFHKTDRGVRTASAVQVRQPLNRKGMGKWRAYEQWLAPLEQSLGPDLEHWDRP